jgi:hypothetical protein
MSATSRLFSAGAASPADRRRINFDPKEVGMPLFRGRGDDGGTKYRMREKMFAAGDDYWIENDAGERAFKVNGKALRIRATLVLETPEGGELFKGCAYPCRYGLHRSDDARLKRCPEDGKPPGQRLKRTCADIHGGRWVRVCSAASRLRPSHTRDRCTLARPGPSLGAESVSVNCVDRCARGCGPRSVSAREFGSPPV